MCNLGNKTNERWEEKWGAGGERKSRNRRFPAESEVVDARAGRDAGTRDGD